MKMIKILQKCEFGFKTRFYAFKEFVKIEFDDKFTFVKLCIHVDVLEGNIERFDLDRWQKFITSDEKMIYEISIG